MRKFLGVITIVSGVAISVFVSFRLIFQYIISDIRLTSTEAILVGFTIMLVGNILMTHE